MSDIQKSVLWIVVYAFIAAGVYFVLRITEFRDDEDTTDAWGMAICWPITLSYFIIVALPWCIMEMFVRSANKAIDQIKENKTSQRRR